MASSQPTPVDPATRITELEAEVDRLRGQLSDRSVPLEKDARQGRSRWRSFWSALLITVACILAPLSVVAVWARGEVTDTERYVATVSPLASDPAVQDAVATRLTNEIFARLDITGFTTEAIDAIAANRDLTDRQAAALAALSGPITTGIQSFTSDKINELVESEAFATAWTQANTVAHQQLVAALSGEDQGALEVNNNAVTLDLGDLVAQVKQRLIDNGFTVAEKIPTVDMQYVLFQSEAIGRAQNAYALLDTLGYWLPIIAIVIALAGVFIANNRRKALIGFGIGLAVAMLVAGISLNLGRAVYLRELPDTVNQAAATAVFDQVVLFVRQALWAGMTAAIVLVLAGVLSGPSRMARGLRGLVKQAAAWIQHTLYSWGATMTGVRAWVAHNATGLRIAAGVGALGVIMVQRYKTPELVLWTTAGLLVVLFVIQVFASGSTEPAEASDPAEAPLQPA